MANNNWRDTMLTTKVLGLNGMSILPLVYWGFDMSWTNFYLSITGVFFFVILQWFSINPFTLLIYIRRSMTGAYRRTVPVSRARRRTFHD